MAIVWEQHYPGGGVTRIVDDAYSDASPEEIQRRLDRLAAVLSDILQMECMIEVAGEDVKNMIHPDREGVDQDD